MQTNILFMILGMVITTIVFYFTTKTSMLTKSENGSPPTGMREIPRIDLSSRSTTYQIIDGNLYGRGDNEYGQLGDTPTPYVNGSPVLIMTNVKDVVIHPNCLNTAMEVHNILILTNEKKAYGLGKDYGSTPVLIDSDVTELHVAVSE